MENFKDYWEFIYLNTRLSRQDAMKAARKTWNKGIDKYTALEEIRQTVTPKMTTTINANWNEYDQIQGKIHLANYGVIFLDEYGCPIDDERLLEELNRKYQDYLVDLLIFH